MLTYPTNTQCIEMDMLCALPAPPLYATLDDLCEDFGVSRQTDVRAMLLDTGLRFVLSQRDGKRIVMLDEFDWACIQPKLLEYWTAIHGA